ncbi:MAG: hypothetical protein IJP01_01880, partial [Oscillospiraceae bacterium]|nr:hypothetical protein [Oscillospiraceae bacterium]
RGLQAVLNHAPPIAALRGEMLDWQSLWSAWSTKRAAQAAPHREKHKAQAGVVDKAPRKAKALWGKGGATKRNLKAAHSSDG